MSTVLRKIKEFYRSLGQGQSGALLPAWREVAGESVPVRFSDALTAYMRDPACKAFVDFLADQTVGMGFYTTVNADYTQAKRVKEAVDEFCESVNLDGCCRLAQEK